MVARKFGLAIGLGVLVVAGLALKARTPETSTKTQDNSTSLVANPDLTQIDYQNGAKVVASYLPDRSSTSRATLRIELSVDNPPISNYDFAKNIVLADTNIDPLPTLSSKVLAQTGGTLSVEMVFVRTAGAHYHLLVKDFVGIRNRVVHFYL